MGHQHLPERIVLRMVITAINATMGRNGLVPSLLVYEALPSFLGISKTTMNQKEQFEALKTARSEMETIVAESRITRALQSKLPPASIYLILPGDLERIFI